MPHLFRKPKGNCWHAGTLSPALSFRNPVMHCAITPRKGYWTLPAGFMEMTETNQMGA